MSSGAPPNNSGHYSMKMSDYLFIMISSGNLQTLGHVVRHRVLLIRLQKLSTLMSVERPMGGSLSLHAVSVITL